jgi:hypothetical protein
MPDTIDAERSPPLQKGAGVRAARDGGFAVGAQKKAPMQGHPLVRRSDRY